MAERKRGQSESSFSHTDELLECKIFDVNRDSVSHFGGRMTFRASDVMVCKIMVPRGSEISSWGICCISVLILYVINNSRMKYLVLYLLQHLILSLFYKIGLPPLWLGLGRLILWIVTIWLKLRALSTVWVSEFSYPNTLILII